MSADQQYEFSQRLNYLCCLGSGEFHEQCVNEVWKEVARLQQSEARALKAEAERDALLKWAQDRAAKEIIDEILAERKQS